MDQPSSFETVVDTSGNDDGIGEPEKVSIVHDELSVFLHAVNLGHLYDKFIRNDYLFTNIFTMTEPDMRKIGISNEDSRKLFLAIQDFGVVVARPPSSLYDTDNESENDSEVESPDDTDHHRKKSVNIDLFDVVAGQVTRSVAQHLLFIETSLGYLKFILEMEPDDFASNLSSGHSSMFGVITHQTCKCKETLKILRKELIGMEEHLAIEYGLQTNQITVKNVSRKSSRTFLKTILTSAAMVGISLLALKTLKKMYDN